MEFIVNCKSESKFVNEELEKATKRVSKLAGAIRDNAYEIAHIIADIDANKAYVDDGFMTVHEWTKSTFGFKKSTSYTMLKIGREYVDTIHDAMTGKVTGYASNLSVLFDGDDDFTVTQIEKMLPAGHDLAFELVESETITPEMTCKEIAKAVKDAMKKDEPETAESDDEMVGDVAETDEIIEVVDYDGIHYLIPKSVLKAYIIPESVR